MSSKIQNRIKILSPEVVKQIAAGEVVERPASVLKELIENAVDAGSNEIKVVIEKGGIEKIQVFDNGRGIDRKNLEIAFERYSTSKIDSSDDLFHISSLGFRGEALYSISSVSKVYVETKVQKEKSGSSISIYGGGKKEIKTVGCAKGTNVIVSDLFFNIPARKKFLKSFTTEFNHIRKCFIAHALSHPKIRFELIHDNRNVFLLPIQTLKERLISIYNLSNKNLLEVSSQHEYLEILGYIGKPGMARSRKVKQHLFVNKRSVENKLVWSAIKKGFGSFLPSGMYPFFCLFLKIRPDLIDVNIHPRKEEVKFVSPQPVFTNVKRIVSSTLEKADLVPTGAVSQEVPKSSQVSKTHFAYSSVSGRRKEGFSKVEDRGSQELELSFPKSKGEKKAQVQQDIKQKVKLFPWEEKIQETVLGSKEKRVFQVSFLYIMEIQEDRILIYDQHALHERVLFEQFVKTYLDKQSEGEGQELLFPEEILLEGQEKEILQKNSEVLQSIGFDLDFQEKGVSISAIPVNLEMDRLKDRFLNFVDSLVKKENFELDSQWQLDVMTKRTLSYLSCRLAVKAGDVLKTEQMLSLIRQFQETKERYTCPHGRPVVVELDREQIDKMFMRR